MNLGLVLGLGPSIRSGISDLRLLVLGDSTANYIFNVANAETNLDTDLDNYFSSVAIYDVNGGSHLYESIAQQIMAQKPISGSTIMRRSPRALQVRRQTKQLSQAPIFPIGHIFLSARMIAIRQLRQQQQPIQWPLTNTWASVIVV